jgi:hypothetical protein
LIKHKESSESQKHRQEDQQQRRRAHYIKEKKHTVSKLQLGNLKATEELNSDESKEIMKPDHYKPQKAKGLKLMPQHPQANPISIPRTSSTS